MAIQDSLQKSIHFLLRELLILIGISVRDELLGVSEGGVGLLAQEAETAVHEGDSLIEVQVVILVGIHLGENLIDSLLDPLISYAHGCLKIAIKHTFLNWH